jgi:hypothetical protein
MAVMLQRVSGSNHVVEVTDSTTQQKSQMALKEWVRYFNNKDRDSVLSVNHLEFSFTNLEAIVDAPEIVSFISYSCEEQLEVKYW